MLNSRKARRIGGAFVTGALALTSTTVVVSQAFAADIDQARTEAVTELKTTDYLTEAQQGLLQDAANQQEDENSLNSWADGIKTLAANQKALKALLDEATTVKASDAYTNATQENKTAYDQAVTGGQAVKMDSLTADSNLESATKALQAAKDALTASTESSSPESSSPESSSPESSSPEASSSAESTDGSAAPSSEPSSEPSSSEGSSSPESSSPESSSPESSSPESSSPESSSPESSSPESSSPESSSPESSSPESSSPESSSPESSSPEASSPEESSEGSAAASSAAQPSEPATPGTTTELSSAKGDANTKIDGLNLTESQKTAAKAKVEAATDTDGVNAALTAATNLADKRTAAAAASDTTTSAYKFADAEKKKAFDEKAAALKAAADADDATADSVDSAIAPVTEASKDLNGETNLQSTVTGISKDDSSLTSAQKEAIKAKAGDAADLTALAAFTATVEKINTAQKALADLVAKADTVKASDGYKNASADAKKAYDEAIEKAKTYLADDFAGIDETALNELTASASDVNSAVNAFSNNTVDYSKLEAAVDKENSDNVTETAAYKNATDEEKATYDTALANAKKILAEKTASQNDVDAAVTALTAARAALSGTEAVSGSSIDLRTALIAAGVGVGLIGIIMAASNALQAPAPAPAAEPAPAANTNKGYVHNYVVGGGAERAEGYAENPETLADEGTAAGTEQGATAAPAAAAARANGRLATTGTSASPWLAGLAAMVMGVALFFGFRRREN